MPYDNIKEAFKTLIHEDTTVEKLTKFLKALMLKNENHLCPLLKRLISH